MKIKFLLLAFLVCWGASANFYCQPDPVNDLIVTGVAIINNNYQGPRQKCYDVPLDAVTRNKNVQAIAVPKSFQGYNGNSAMDYSVQIGQSDKGVSIVLMANSDLFWKSIQVSYLITARSDLWVGSFIANSFPFLGCWRNDQRSSILQTQIAIVGAPIRRSVVAFVSGMRTQTRAFSIQLKNVVCDEKSGLLSVSISTNAVLQFIQISYIVYDLASPLDVVQFAYFNADELARRVYAFSGVGGFVSNGVVINSLGFGVRQLVCQGTGCPGNCISVDGCKKQGGFLTDKICVLCRGDQIISNGQCVKPCGTNYIYTPSGCSCPTGFVKVGKQCFKICAANAIFIGGQCTCLAGYYASGEKCVPIPSCGENQYFDGKLCSCLNSNYIKNRFGKCELKKVCRDNQRPNEYNECVCLDTCWRDDNGRCWPRPNCRENEEHDGRGQCRCIPTCWKDDNGRCWPRPNCRQNEEHDGRGQCRCIPGCWKNSQDRCVPRKVCKQNEQNDMYGDCQCINTCWRNQFGSCVPKPYCNLNNNEIYNNNGGCNCIDGFYRNYQGQCVRKPICNQYQFMNDRYQCICIPGCSKGPNGCQPIPSCSGGKVVDSSGFCTCPTGTVEVDNVCRKKCQDFAYAAEVSSGNGKPPSVTCTCLKGYYRPKSWQKCQPIKLCTQSNEIEVNGKCQCEPGYGRNSRGKCERIVCLDPNEVIIGTSCQCKQGWIKNSNGRCELKCGDYEDLSGNQCVCKPGCGYNSQRKCYPVCKNTEVWTVAGCICRNPDDVRINGECTSCPAYSKPRPDRLGCDCVQGYTYDARYNQCFANVQCPFNSSPVYINNGYKCLCFDGFVMRNDKCVKCHENSYSNPDRTDCICFDGHYYEPRVSCCVKGEQPKCPLRSTWNYDKKQCECTVFGENLINGECRQCDRNEGWNGKQCVCVTNYYRINGVCTTCDLNTYYDGRQCVCNLGFYGAGGKCYKCHETCGKCTGPNFNDCLTCSDVSYTLNNGCCTRGLCPVNLYFQQQSKKCLPCSSNCATCRSQQKCDSCISGFNLKSMSSAKKDISYCVEICGDGKRFELECDDGNNVDGDGCNCNCEQEKGWHCSGGSSIRPSVCVPWKPDRCMIIPKGAVHLFGRVVQGVRLSYIPDVLLENDGAKCSKLLLIKVIKSDVVPGIRVSFVPKSRYQFYIEFEFNGLFSIPVFQFTVQINPEFKQFFSLEDMAQLQMISLDPATLAKPNDKIGQKNELSQEDVVGVPEQAKSILNGEEEKDNKDNKDNKDEKTDSSR